MSRRQDPIDALKTIEEAAKLPQLQELAAELMDEFGGVKRLAKLVKTVFDSAPEGSTAQQKILESVLRICERASEASRLDETSLAEMSREELERLVGPMLRDVGGGGDASP